VKNGGAYNLLTKLTLTIKSCLSYSLLHIVKVAFSSFAMLL